MKIEKEMEVVFLMIEIYCKKKHTRKKKLCPECEELKNYVEYRLSKCPYQDNKKFCSNCKIHCYKPEMREKIKKVMRFSGPRLIFYHPIIALKHLIENFKEKSNEKKQNTTKK